MLWQFLHLIAQQRCEGDLFRLIRDEWLIACLEAKVQQYFRVASVRRSFYSRVHTPAQILHRAFLKNVHSSFYLFFLFILFDQLMCHYCRKSAIE